MTTEAPLTYKDYEIKKTLDHPEFWYSWSHADYCGEERDYRWGRANSFKDCVKAIDEYIKDHQEQPTVFVGDEEFEV